MKSAQQSTSMWYVCSGIKCFVTVANESSYSLFPLTENETLPTLTRSVPSGYDVSGATEKSELLNIILCGCLLGVLY